MTTARDLITSAFCKLQVYKPGEQVADIDVAQGLSALNNMMDVWSNQSLACYAILEQSFTLIVGQSQYTIGTSGGATINLPRPIRILDGPGAAYLMDSNSNRYPVNVIPRDQWNLIGQLTANSNIPDTMFYDPQYPLGVINIFPVPNISNTLYWDSYQQLSGFSSLSSSLSLPPGYQSAIENNLAIRLKAYYPAAVLDPTTVKLAADDLAFVKRSNIRANVAVYDAEIVARGYSTYNIYSDRGGGSAQS